MKWVSIALFGALGGGLRAWIATATFGMRETSLTVLFNLCGAFALGYLSSSRVTSCWPGWLRTGMSTGFLGALTTFSGFLGDVLQWSRVDPFVCVGVLCATVIGGLVAALAGIGLGVHTDSRRVDSRRQQQAVSNQTQAKELTS